MAEEDKWVTFDSSDDGDEEEESLSFSNLPVDDPDNKNPEKGRSSPAKDEHFEFRILGAGAGNGLSEEFATMCAADEVFFHGQLLPLGPTHPVSRCDSAASLSFESSSSVSRSVSSSSSDGPPLRRVWSSALYAYPSPSPRVPARRNFGGAAGRRSTGTAPPAGWGLLRLGVVMAPEMELQDIRLRRRTGVGDPRVVKKGSAVWRLLGGGGLMGCGSSPEDAVSGEIKKKKVERRNRVAGTTERTERMFEWLEELSVGKEPLIN